MSVKEQGIKMPIRSYGKGYYALRYKVLERDEYTCQYCGQKAPDVILHVDHRIAVEDGGSDEPENLVTSCSACNMGKNGLAVIFKRKGRGVKGYIARSLFQPIRPNAFRRDEAMNLISKSAGIRTVELAQQLNISYANASVVIHRLKKLHMISQIDGKWHPIEVPE